MADELERVRISAAELRTQASNFNTHCSSVKDLQRETKRPDLQRYKPHRSKDDTQDHTLTATLDSDQLPASDCDETPKDTQRESKKQRSRGGSAKAHQHVNENAVQTSEVTSVGTHRSPKRSRKMRKPDREIYQPGGRRSQGNLANSREPAENPEEREGRLAQKEPSEKMPVGKEEKRGNRRGKDSRKRVEQENQCKESADKTENNMGNVTSKVSNLQISCQTVDQSEKSREKDEEASNRRRRGQAGGEEKNERVNKKSRAWKEKGNNQAFALTERSGKSAETAQSEQIRSKKGASGNEDRDQNMSSDKQKCNRPREKAGEKGKVYEKSDLSQISSSSKRYSQSDMRRPRNRTYSTSSASSGTSADGLAEVHRLRAQDQRFSGRTVDRPADRRDFIRGNHPRTRRRTARTLSSTDSLEENEIWEKDERRGPEAEDAGSTCRGIDGGRGGILLVSLNKHSSTKSEEQGSRKTHRGCGRGILILPARPDLGSTPEAGPKVAVMSRGVGLSKGKGSRGGGTRRLWDPNNPDKKPALISSLQSQHASLQQALYPQQGGCGPLHFLDTDDETAGSPPIRQGEYLQNQQAAAMAYYKFQNSDNPYCYPLSASSPASSPRYPYSFHVPYQIPSSNGMFPASPMPPFYGPYGQRFPGGSALTPEEVEVQTRGELGKLLRLADSQELQLSNLLSRDRLSQDGLERMTKLRSELLALYERVILTDIEFSDSQNLDQALWKNVFYQVIERFRQLLKEQMSETSLQIKTVLMSLLEEGAAFFDSLLQKLQTVFQFKLEDYMDCMAIRAKPLRKTVKFALISAQRCLICQGDIARYREQASDSANYGKARSWYLKAQQIAPKNGRPYNQLALLAVYTKRKLDAVYYYMRSLAASNPILTAKESLMSLFEEAKRKAEQVERRRKQDSDGGSRDPREHAGGRGTRSEDAARVEIWIRPSGNQASSRAGSGSGKDSEQDGELCALSASDLNKRFILSFLHTHGKLFTKVGMESFSVVASRVLQEFRALLQHSPSPLGSTRMLQIITINMFTIHNAQIRAEGQGESRSVLEEQTISLGLAMFGLLVQRCTELLKEAPAEPIPAEELAEFDEMDEEEGMVRVSAFPPDLKELLPSIKIWSDWMLGHQDKWNPPPRGLQDGPDVWQSLANLCNSLSHVYHGEVLLYKPDTDGEGDEEFRVLQLEEDKMLSGFVPLLAAPQEPCYVDRGTDTGIAADCKRVTVLKYFLQALCGQEEPLLAFKGGKYISMAIPLTSDVSADNKAPTLEPEDDVIVEESSLSASEAEIDGDGSEDDIRELRARRHALAHALARQQKRQHKIQEVLQTRGQLEIEVRPFYLIPDTNGFIDHVDSLRKLLVCGSFILVVPLIVITELDGLAKGQDGRAGSEQLQDRARAAVTFLEKAFESREPCIRALTSRGNTLESIAFRSEDTSGHQGNNDDVILSCCLHYCQDKAKDFMPAERNGPVRLRREVVLLTDDRNLRVKALTRNVPVRDIPAFLSWAKVG